MGNGIKIDRAKTICSALNLNFYAGFDVKVISRSHAKETILKLKRILATILADAKRQRLVEYNFASYDYIAPIQGHKKEVKKLNDKEAVTSWVSR